jgi:hypothetical protein
MLSGFDHLLIGSVLSNKQSLILDHSKSDWDTPTELIIRKVCSEVAVPRLKLLEYGRGFLSAGDSNWNRRVVKLNSKHPCGINKTKNSKVWK